MRSSERTWPGRQNFLVSGMEQPFSFFPPLSLCMTFPSVLMHLVLLVMVLLWTVNGAMVGGLLSNFHCPLLTRSFFWLFQLPMFGVLVGPSGALCFTLTTKLLFTFLTHGCLQTQTLCIILCIAYLKRLPASVLHLLLFTFQEEITAQLTHYLASIFRPFILKCHRPRIFQSSSLFSSQPSFPQSLRSSLPFIHVSRPYFFNSPHIFLCPGKVRKFLHHDWTSHPLWFSMPSLGMDPLPFCHRSC